MVSPLSVAPAAGRGEGKPGAVALASRYVRVLVVIGAALGWMSMLLLRVGLPGAPLLLKFVRPDGLDRAPA